MSRNDEQLICEALVREIGLAKRWSGVKEAWESLLHVRLMAKSLKNEEDMKYPEGSIIGPFSSKEMKAHMEGT